MLFTEAEIETLLDQSNNPSQIPETPYPRGLLHDKLFPAAVLIPLMIKDGAWHLLFIRRTFQKNDRHSGQVAFPGGRSDLDDHTADHTAKRETYEEIGIKPEDVRVLGRLRDLVTITGYQVTPIVGVIPWPYPTILQPQEVEKIFTIPLQWLADPSNRVVMRRELKVKGESVPVIYFEKYSEEVLWGASGRITMLLLEALGLSSSADRYK